MRILRILPLLVLLILAVAAPAGADIIFYNSPGGVQPEENLLFPQTGLITNGIPVQGQTNRSETIFNITGNEDLITTQSKGQARVEAADGGTFMSATFDALDPDLFFTLFEANILVSGTTEIIVRAKEGPEGPTHDYTYTGLTSGQNFFGLEATNGQLIDFIRVSTEPNYYMDEIKQIRIGGISDSSGDRILDPVPEPASLLLLGTGLGVIGLAAWRRKK